MWKNGPFIPDEGFHLIAGCFQKQMLQLSRLFLEEAIIAHKDLFLSVWDLKR